MRNSFIGTLTELAKKDSSIYLLSGDLGFGALTPFWESFPDQFINAGISEQNMTAMAAGMAMENKTIFTYSIANFPTLRALEQIRNDISYHNANVKIISIGAGFAYGPAGMSHHSTEDISIMRALPNITVFSPADKYETIAVTQEAYKINGPCYIRLGKGGEACFHDHPLSSEVIYSPINIKKGQDICIISTGAILQEAIKAQEILLEKYNRSVSVYSLPVISPLDKNIFKNIFNNYKIIFTLEEHNLAGGLGSLIAENLVDSHLKNPPQIYRLGLKNTYASIVGSQQYLREQYALNFENIIDNILKI